METMIERVARAIYETEPFEISLRKGMPWADVHESQKEGFRVKARAAVEAMGKPTEGMLQAGYGHHYRLETKLGRSKAELDYDDMIRAALKEQEEK